MVHLLNLLGAIFHAGDMLFEVIDFQFLHLNLRLLSHHLVIEPAYLQFTLLYLLNLFVDLALFFIKLVYHALHNLLEVFYFLALRDLCNLICLRLVRPAFAIAGLRDRLMRQLLQVGNYIVFGLNVSLQLQNLDFIILAGRVEFGLQILVIVVSQLDLVRENVIFFFDVRQLFLICIHLLEQGNYLVFENLCVVFILLFELLQNFAHIFSVALPDHVYLIQHQLVALFDVVLAQLQVFRAADLAIRLPDVILLQSLHLLIVDVDKVVIFFNLLVIFLIGALILADYCLRLADGLLEEIGLINFNLNLLIPLHYFPTTVSHPA